MKAETDLMARLAELRRKANREWELAGLARMNRDPDDERRHTALARKYESEIKDIMEAIR